MKIWECENCGGEGKTVDSRDNSVGRRRRYKCKSCGSTWSTVETRGELIRHGAGREVVPLAVTEFMAQTRTAIQGHLDAIGCLVYGGK